MDFVIYGFGLGALLLLLGVAAQDLGPRLLKQSAPAASLTADPSKQQSRAGNSWRKLVPLAGPTLMIGGAVVTLATFAGIFLQLSDQDGSRLVLGAFLVAVIGTVIRLPFLARAKPAQPKPKIAKRPPPPPRERPRPARPPRQSTRQPERPQVARQRPIPDAPKWMPKESNGKRVVGPDRVNGPSIPDLPDIFDPNEPVQTGLLEKLLAEGDQIAPYSSHFAPEGESPEPEQERRSVPRRTFN